MTTYIAHFTAKHRVILIEQHSIFIWQQESGEIDQALLSEKIIRESSIHFYRLAANTDLNICSDDITVVLYKTVPFLG